MPRTRGRPPDCNSALLTHSHVLYCDTTNGPTHAPTVVPLAPSAGFQCLLLRLGHCGSYRSRAPLSVRKNTAATAATVALKTPCFDLIDVGLLILASNATDLRPP